VCRPCQRTGSRPAAVFASILTFPSAGLELSKIVTRLFVDVIVTLQKG